MVLNLTILALKIVLEQYFISYHNLITGKYYIVLHNIHTIKINIRGGQIIWFVL